MKHTTCILLVLTTFLILLSPTRCRVIQEEENNGNSRQRRNASRRDKNKTWNASTIPYATDAKFASDIKTAIENSIKLIEKNTCLRFKQRTNEKEFINFVLDTNGTRCSSELGAKNGIPTEVSLTKFCGSIGSVIHELIHALGFHHEHNRPDALKYVAFNKSNAIPSFVWSLNPYGIDVNGNDDGVLEIIGPYDYQSIMHYGNYGMSRNKRKGLTIMNKFRKDMKLGPGRQFLPTKLDYLKLKVYFKCPGNQCKNINGDKLCAKNAKCEWGHYLKVCRKYCKYCGQSCTNKMTDFYCIHYAIRHCNERWAQNECPVTCNACPNTHARLTTTRLPTTTWEPGCSNARKDIFCETLDRQGDIPNYCQYWYVRTNCKKTCGRC